MMSNGPKFVVHAAENIKGGVGTYLRDLMVEQRRSFGEGAVIAVVPETQRDVLGSPEGVEIVPFDNRGPRWLSTLRLAGRMREVVSCSRPAVVHLHSTFAGLALRPLLRWMSTDAAIVYCPHGWAFDREAPRVVRAAAAKIERALAPLCHAIVCISEHERRIAAAAGIPAHKLVRISNGVPREIPTGDGGSNGPAWPEGKRRVLFVGRFDRQKGVDLLLRALEPLADTTFAWLVGDAVLRDGAALTLPPNARTTGWLAANEITAYYQTAEVIVVASRWEGFGLIAAEAMRAGLPVIGTRVGGLAEVVEHGVTGWLVETDSPKAITAALRHLDDRTLRAMGDAARRRFLEHFTMDRTHAQLTALYRALLARTAAPSAIHA